MFKGRKSNDLNMRVLNEMQFNLPEADFEFQSVDGKSFDVILDKNKFKDIEKTFPMRLFRDPSSKLSTQLRDIAGWLYSSGGYSPLVFSEYDDYYYKAFYYSSTTADDKYSDSLIINFTFKCQPFVFRLDGEEEREIISGTALTNPEPFDSLPLVSFNKTTSTTDSTLFINGKQYTIAKEAGLGLITIDSETGIAYKEGGVNVSRYCLVNSSGYHPITLQPGRNEISYNNMNQVKIKPRWRNLAI